MKVPLCARTFEDFNTHKTKIELWANKEKRIFDIPIKPYLYSRKERQLPNSTCSVENVKFISDLHSEQLYKYSFDSVKDIPIHRDSDSLECDIPFLQRVAIDSPDFYEQFSQTNNLDILYFDIETDTDGLFPKPKRNIIVSISYALNNGNVVTYSVNDIKEGDKTILSLFFDDIAKLNPDVIVGYNHLGFDLPYIIDRAIINGISTRALTRGKGEAYFINQKGQTILNIQGRALFDVFEEVVKDQTLYGISGRGLKDVAKWFNVDKKIKQDPRYRNYEIVLEFRGDMRSLVGTQRMQQYIESDVLITRALSEFYFKNIITFAEMLKVPVDMMTKRTANLIGTIVYARELRKLNVISDNPNFKRFPKVFGQPDFIERKGRWMFTGGTGMQGALVGLFDNGKSLPLFSELKRRYQDVWKIDFSGMYPSIQRTFNLSPETSKIISVAPYNVNQVVTWSELNDIYLLGIPDRKMGFVTIKIQKKQGFLPRMLTEMHFERQKIKQQLKDSATPAYLKESLESLSWTIKVMQNANYGLNGSAYFRYGDIAVTIATTGLGRYFMQLVLDQDIESNIACDTDGVYLTGKPDVDYYNQFLTNHIQSKFGVSSHMELDMEGPFPNAYFLKRKNYVLQRKDGSIIKHGNSFKGTSKNMLFAYALDKMINAVFGDSSKIQKVISDCTNLDMHDLKMFIQKTRINRPIGEYDAQGCLQVQMAKQLSKIHDINVEQGDSIDYVKHESGYVIKDLASMRNIDRDYYLRQVERVLARLNLSDFKIEGGGKVSKQLTLGDM